MTDLRQKLTDRIDQLQTWMESNYHRKDNDSNMEVWDHCLSLSRFWSVLSEEDRDFIEGAKHAVIEKSKWNV
tara:strand:+ start:1433 stop:1648 length:216 start_codon:yes stop_codon:yes gene_type:complete